MWLTVVIVICTACALAIAGCGNGGSDSGTAGSYSDGGGGGIITGTSALTAVNNLSSQGQPIRPGDWIELIGSNFGATQGSSYVGFTNGAATTQAALYDSWSDSKIVCRVPEGTPMSDRYAVREITNVFVSTNGVGNSNTYTAPSDPTPNPTPQPTPPSLTPTPTPTTTTSPTPTPTTTTSPTPTPSPTSGGGGGGGGGGGTQVAKKLVFTVNPPAAVDSGVAIDPPVKVEIRDQYDNLVSEGAGSTYTVSLEVDSGGTLSGNSVAAVGGVATFGSLTASPPGTGYILTATSGTLTADTSSAFDVNPRISGVVSYCSGSTPIDTSHAKVVATPNGDAGTIVDIKGSGFGTTQGTVFFAGPDAVEHDATSSVTTWNDGLIQCTMPTDVTAGDGYVKVTESGGTSEKSTFIICPDGMTYVPASESFYSNPVKALYMGECEVTNGELDATNAKDYIKTYISNAHSGVYSGTTRPAENVSWYIAVVYCNYMTITAGLGTGECCYTITGYPSDTPTVDYDNTRKGYRLGDSVAVHSFYHDTITNEWEYACRGGTVMSWLYYWGSAFDNAGLPVANGTDYCWYSGNQPASPNDGTQMVGQKIPNLWGLYDMSGNVWEWCNEKYGGDRVVRGGGWYNVSDFSQSSLWLYFEPWHRVYCGFRLVRTK